MADFEQRAKSRREALLALITGAAAEPAAGIAGLYGVVTGGLDKGVQNIERTRQALTYQPRDPSALQAMGRAVEPVTSRLEALRNGMGDQAFDRTGSPGAATAAYMVPDTLLTLLGARGAGVKGPKLSQMVERSQGPTMGSPKAQIGAIMPDEYGGLHRPPMRDSGAPLHDVTGGGKVYPDDVYGDMAARYYGHGDPKLDAATIRLVQSYRNNPDLMVPIYRAVPKGAAADAINPGDWVTINKAYAKMHGEGFDDGYTIIEQRVPARDIYTNGDSIHEWGYDPQK